MRSKIKISTPDEALDALGGTVKASRFFNIVPHATSMMRRRGIPSSYHLRLYMHLTSLGYEINTESLFGYGLTYEDERQKERRNKVSAE